MTKYSHFFQTIYDEKKPVGNLGRGTHYSVLRSIVFSDTKGEELKKATYHDFAVIWDEDHDTRIIWVLEQLYYKRLLPFFTIFGERKGGLTLLSEYDTNNLISLPGEIETQPGIDGDTDTWTLELGDLHDTKAIINADADKVGLYLSNINMLWNLGTKSIRDNESCAKTIDTF